MKDNNILDTTFFKEGFIDGKILHKEPLDWKKSSKFKRLKIYSIPFLVANILLTIIFWKILNTEDSTFEDYFGTLIVFGICLFLYAYPLLYPLIKLKDSELILTDEKLYILKKEKIKYSTALNIIYRITVLEKDKEFEKVHLSIKKNKIPSKTKKIRITKKAKSVTKMIEGIKDRNAFAKALLKARNNAMNDV